MSAPAQTSSENFKLLRSESARVIEKQFNSSQHTLCLTYYLQYVSGASFHTFHASGTSRVVDNGRIPFLYGIFWADIHAVVTRTTFSHRRYIDGFVVSKLLNFIGLQQLHLLSCVPFDKTSAMMRMLPSCILMTLLRGIGTNPPRWFILLASNFIFLSILAAIFFV